MSPALIQVVNAVEVKIDGAALREPAKSAMARVEVVQRLNAPATAVVGFHDSAIEGDSVLDDSAIGVGKEMTVSFKADDQSPEVVFSGKVSAVGFEVEAGASYVTISAHDGLQRLFHGTSLKTRQDAKYSDAIRDLAGAAGLGSSVDATTATWNYLPQAWLSDGEFITSLAAEIGYVFYARDNKLHFKKPAWTQASGASVKHGENLLRFRTVQTDEALVKKVTVRGWDVKNKRSIAAIESTITTKGAALEKDPASLYEGSKELTVSALTVPDQTTAKTLATTLAERIGDTACTADGLAAGDPKIRPDSTITVEAVPKKVAGKYYVTEARHSFLDGEYHTEFRCTGVLDSSLWAAAAAGSRAQAPMPQQQTHPFTVVPAVVTNNKYADAKGNPDVPAVKVKIPSISDTDETDWLRLVSLGAGDKRGFLVVPDVGDEVLVAFAEGNVRMGYVLGGLYNGKDKPGEPMATNAAIGGAENNLKGFVSRSGHQVILDDKDGQERILIMDKTGKQQLLFAAKDSTILVESEQNKVLIDGKGKKIDVESKGDITLKADGKINLEATQDIVMKSTGKTTMQASQDFELKGMNVKINGDMNAEVKGGVGAKLEGGAQTTVKGGMVMIN